MFAATVVERARAEPFAEGDSRTTGDRSHDGRPRLDSQASNTGHEGVRNPNPGVPER